jgi:hypothetical protein
LAVVAGNSNLQLAHALSPIRLAETPQAVEVNSQLALSVSAPCWHLASLVVWAAHYKKSVLVYLASVSAQIANVQSALSASVAVLHLARSAAVLAALICFAVSVAATAPIRARTAVLICCVVFFLNKFNKFGYWFPFKPRDNGQDMDILRSK